MDLIRNQAPTKPTLKSAFGENIQPLGFDRFKTCELMAELLHCSNMGLLNERGSESEMRQRDQNREKLKAEGKLGNPQADTTAELDEQFASSVDSHGFHHAEAPGDDLSNSPDKVNRLEVQNVSDEDGFEKVAVPDAEALPDEITFDDFNEKVDESSPEKATNESRQSAATDDSGNEDVTNDSLAEQIEHLTMSDEKHDSAQEAKPRVSSLTKQIQDHISATESNADQENQHATESSDVDVNAVSAEDKPAPLFASKQSPSKGTDPILGTGDDDDGQESSARSTATLQPESEVSQTAESAGEPPAFEMDIDGTPVVGDLLKIQFVEHQVVPTILVSLCLLFP